MSNHTPGKWEERANSKDSIEIWGPCYLIALLNGYVSDEELAANAHLVAASPELLVLLKEAMGHLDEPPGYWETRMRASDFVPRVQALLNILS